MEMHVVIIGLVLHGDSNWSQMVQYGKIMYIQENEPIHKIFEFFLTFKSP